MGEADEDKEDEMRRLRKPATEPDVAKLIERASKAMADAMRAVWLDGYNFGRGSDGNEYLTNEQLAAACKASMEKKKANAKVKS